MNSHYLSVMADIDSQIQSIHDKLQKLLKHQQTLQKANERLEQELRVQADQLLRKEQQLQQVSRELDAARVGGLLNNDTEKKALQQRINEYLKEIDKCLALLNG